MNPNTPPQYKSFGAGRWIIYIFGLIIFGLLTIFILKTAVKDAKDYSQYKAVSAIVGYKENACSSSDHSQSLYDYSATASDGKGYIIRCSDQTLNTGAAVNIYVLPSSQDAYISRFSLQKNIVEEFGYAIATGAISLYLIYALKQHRTRVGDDWKNSFRH